jgi:hypothetical protein
MYPESFPKTLWVCLQAAGFTLLLAGAIAWVPVRPYWRFLTRGERVTT